MSLRLFGFWSKNKVAEVAGTASPEASVADRLARLKSHK